MWNKKNGDGKLRILVAEDNPHDQLLFALAVEDSTSEASVTFADDGIELLEKAEAMVAKTKRPDIIVLDLHMPKLDGHSTLIRLSERPHLASIDVIVFSSSLHPKEVKRSIELGALDHVVKPSTYEQLMSFVDSLRDGTYATRGDGALSA